jgi:hypothetical protein
MNYVLFNCLNFKNKNLLNFFQRSGFLNFDVLFL